MSAPIIRGNSLYSLTPYPNHNSWQDAENGAVSMGGHLVEINDSAENQFILNVFTPSFLQTLPSHYLGIPLNTAYIGLFYDPNTKSSVWTNGETGAYRNLDPYLSNNFDWNLQNGNHLGVIELNPSIYGERAGSWYLTSDLYGYWNKYGIAEIPLTSSITFSATPKEGAGEFTTSINLSAGTQSTGNLAEAAHVYWKITGIQQSDLASGYALTGDGYITNGKLDFKEALVDDHIQNSKSLSVSVYSDSGYQNQIGTTQTSQVQDAFKTPVIRGNSLYTIVDGPSWTQAEANSVKLGGHLASINTVEENSFLTTKFILENLPINDGQYRAVWIGYYSPGNNKDYVWSDGSGSSFNNWSPGQPSNSYGVEHFADLQFSGEWNDLPNDYWNFNVASVNSIKGIVEIPLTSSITFSTTPKEGAGEFTTSINLSAGTQSTGNLAEGAHVYWKITGIQQSDLASGYALTGDGYITNGKLEVKEALVQDNVQENETLSFSVYSDSDFTQQIGTTVSSVIQDPINLDIGSTTTTASQTTTLASTISRLVLTGTGNINGTGNALNNYLKGNDGNNVLDGGGGNDILDGGKGNDTYIVDSIYDRVVESLNEGTDAVISSVSWTLGLNLENLTLSGADPLTGIGNSLNNTMVGNAGNNVLDGMGGTNILTGGAGADVFRFSVRPNFGSSTADHITDFKGSEGDVLQINQAAFGLASNATVSLTTVGSATELTTALGSASTFVYDFSSGNLYWNQNGTKSGFGSGGIFAVLDNHGALNSSNISLV